jgi:hypothetical protein
MSQEQRAALLNGPYLLQVDYSRSIEDSLGAGRYDWLSSRVTSVSFPSAETGQGRISAVLIPFSPQASLDYVLHLPAAAGMRPATFKELLAFGEAYPDVQRKLPVISLGSSVDLMVTIYHRESSQGSSMLGRIEIEYKRERVYPFLNYGPFGRTVSLEWLDDPEAYPMYYACFVRQP